MEVKDKQCDTSLDWIDEPIKANKWTNLYFRKNGESELGFTQFNSEIEALNFAIELINLGAGYGIVWKKGHTIPLDSGEKGIRCSEISHAIQMPVKT